MVGRRLFFQFVVFCLQLVTVVWFVWIFVVGIIVWLFGWWAPALESKKKFE